MRPTCGLYPRPECITGIRRRNSPYLWRSPGQREARCFRVPGLSGLHFPRCNPLSAPPSPLGRLRVPPPFRCRCSRLTRFRSRSWCRRVRPMCLRDRRTTRQIPLRFRSQVLGGVIVWSSSTSPLSLRASAKFPGSRSELRRRLVHSFRVHGFRRVQFPSDRGLPGGCVPVHRVRNAVAGMRRGFGSTRSHRGGGGRCRVGS